MIKNKKKPCKSCGKETYGRLCFDCQKEEKLKKRKPSSARKPLKKKPVKKSKGRKSKYPKVTTIKKHCSDLHSLFVRLRDSKANGMGKCITCNRECFFYDDCFDAGHMFSRRLMSTHYDDRNVNGQCKGCNGPGNGQQYEYGMAIDEKCGKGTAMELRELSKQTKKMGFIDYLEIMQEKLPKCYEMLKKKKIEQDVVDRILVRLDFYKRYVDRIVEKLKQN